MSSQGHHKMQKGGGGGSGTSSKMPSTMELNEPTDEIDLGERFSTDMTRLCMNERYADVEFIVEEQRLPAHRVILAARSEYFRALLYGGMCETTQRCIPLDVPLDPFKVLLRYIYSGTLSLAALDEYAIIDVLGMANQYGLMDLEMAISRYLRQYLALGNVCMILDAARLYNLDELTDVCLMFMDRNAAELLQHESFKMLSKESLEEILKRDCFFAPEVQIFLAVWKWSRYNPKVDFKSVVAHVRLPLMNLEHLLKVVRPSGILEPDKILDAIDEHSTSKTLPYRAALWPEENVATAKYLSRCIQGECRSALLDGDVTTYDMERGYTRHCISDGNDAGIVVELGIMCMINHLRILLWDRDSRAYSYFVEVSGNQTHWERVVDYSEFHCRSWQSLYFPARPVRYIRLVGTQNTVNRVFHVVGLEAMHTAKMPTLVNGFVVPKANVATIAMSAIVTDGVSRTRNALINGDFVCYDWDSGYTCHQLGSGEIVVRLGQPYFVGSMRLLLWDCDDRTYSFYIETSTNRKDWQMVVDKRNEQVRSWQNFHFTPRPVVFIRIVGTRNTANESHIQIFHCVHLECPTQDKNYLKKIAAEQELEKERQGVKAGDKEAKPKQEATNSPSSNSLRSSGSSTPPAEEAANSSLATSEEGESPAVKVDKVAATTARVAPRAASPDSTEPAAAAAAALGQLMPLLRITNEEQEEEKPSTSSMSMSMPFTLPESAVKVEPLPASPSASSSSSTPSKESSPESKPKVKEEKSDHEQGHPK